MKTLISKSYAEAAERLVEGDIDLAFFLEAMPSDGSKLWFGIWVAPGSVGDFDNMSCSICIIKRGCDE